MQEVVIVIADKIAGDTPLQSLQVGTEDIGTSAGAARTRIPFDMFTLGFQWGLGGS